MPTQLQWDQTWLQVAKTVSKLSKDPSTKVGSVIVTPDNRHCSFHPATVISAGWIACQSFRVQSAPLPHQRKVIMSEVISSSAPVSVVTNIDGIVQDVPMDYVGLDSFPVYRSQESAAAALPNDGQHLVIKAKRTLVVARMLLVS